MKTSKCPCCGEVIKPDKQHSAEQRYEVHMRKHPLYNPGRKFEKTKTTSKRFICPDCEGKKSEQGIRCRPCYIKKRFGK